MSTGLLPTIHPLPLGDSAWRRRRPENSALHRVLAEHLNTFLEQAESSSSGQSYPWFVKRELRALLSCGILARGFLRVYCPTCKTSALLAFSCKKRGFCASCCARRMADTAAHLVDRILPDVPVRQWVLTFPFRLRYLLAYNRKLCGAVRKTCLRALLTFLRRRARRSGIPDGESGAVCSVQRAGGAINVNVHFHILALDGVFYEPDEEAKIDFQHLPAPSDFEVRRLLTTIQKRVDRVLAKHGLDRMSGGADRDADDSGMAACLENAGRVRPVRLGREPLPPMPEFARRRCAEQDGYTLHADTLVPGGDRLALERLARYITRPPIASERLSLTDQGRVLYRLRSPFHDGTTVLSFEPTQLIARLCSLVPPPRFHLVTYHGVLAPNHAWRADVVFHHDSRPRARSASASTASRRLPWADLLRRVYAFDVLLCDRCGSAKKIIATITRRDVICKILAAQGLPSDPPFVHPARCDPLLF